MAATLPLYGPPAIGGWPLLVTVSAAAQVTAIIAQVTGAYKFDDNKWCNDTAAVSILSVPNLAARRDQRLALYKWIASMISGVDVIPTPTRLAPIRRLAGLSPREERLKCIGADLSHDIEHFIETYVLPYFSHLGMGMQIGNLRYMASDDKHILRYYNDLSDFKDNFSLGIYKYEPTLDELGIPALKQLLARKGCNGFLLDAWYINLYQKGLGGAPLIHYDPTASRIDGGSKVLATNTNNSQVKEVYGDFSVPFFYENMEHVIGYDSSLGIATIKVYKNSVLQFTATCSSGFSVNACCIAAGHASGPRKKGIAGQNIEIQEEPGIIMDNIRVHIELIKSITDWASLIFIKYMYVVHGIIIALITNDRFCLRMAKYLRLPFAITTPSTALKHCEAFCFDNNVLNLSDAQQAQIYNKLRGFAGGDIADELAHAFDITSDPNDIIILAWNKEINAIVEALKEKRRVFNDAAIKATTSLLVVGGQAPAYMADVAYLATMDHSEYLFTLCKSKLLAALDKFVTLKNKIHDRILEYNAGVEKARQISEIKSIADELTVVPEQRRVLYRNIFPNRNIVGLHNDRSARGSPTPPSYWDTILKIELTYKQVKLDTQSSAESARLAIEHIRGTVDAELAALRAAATAARATTAAAVAPGPALVSGRKRPEPTSTIRGNRNRAMLVGTGGVYVNPIPARSTVTKRRRRQHGGGVGPSGLVTARFNLSKITDGNLDTDTIQEITKAIETCDAAKGEENHSQQLMGAVFVNIIFKNIENDIEHNIIFMLDLLDALSEDADACNYNPSYDSDLDNLYNLLDEYQDEKLDIKYLILELLYVVLCTPVIEIISNGLTFLQRQAVTSIAVQMLHNALPEIVTRPEDRVTYDEIINEAKTEAGSALSQVKYNGWEIKLAAINQYWNDRYLNEFLLYCSDQILNESEFSGLATTAWLAHARGIVLPTVDEPVTPPPSSSVTAPPLLTLPSPAGGAALASASATSIEGSSSITDRPHLTPTHSASSAGGARKSRKNKSRKNRTRKANNRKYNRRTRRNKH